MTPRRWIIVIAAFILMMVISAGILRTALHFWHQWQLASLLNGPPPSDEVLTTDDSLTALNKRASQAERSHDYQRAVDLYTQGLEESSYRADARRALLRQRAFAYENLKQYDRAEADYNASLQIEPLDPSFYAKRGFYLIRRGRYDDALADFRKGGELVPSDGTFPFGEGEVYAKLGQHEKSAERYSEAIRWTPQAGRYYRERGSAYNRLGKFKEAKTDYDKALALARGYIQREAADSNLGRGYASLRLGHYQDAIADFDAVLRVMPRSSAALAWRGTAYQSLGKSNEAVADFKAALAIDPKNANAMDGLKSFGVPAP
ncbi:MULTISPECIES: tetratricopeptide repeat protein [unclassified Bradyrhizobium]|uniref:tetratricopeptide repeat protein n=1 Tax=Bradyrhizobium TaxID=374 RepID=UPI001CD7F5C1|nr:MULTISPECIES: tetratricopeptide repeat protein [unclassified Bradyrhizobium]MCA1498921.1 tetratricopeptide repeat protein [Bradyrhizobium sp. NBAIM14]MCA1535275.1 tetratricopeptide repeat protein [Bradyrhizobium sp. NBAIM03]